MNIAVDGYAASGKSVLAKEIAKALKIKVFDTGALYRAVACEWDKRKMTEINEKSVENFINSIGKIEVKFIGDSQLVLIDGFDYTTYLRSEKISMLAAKLSPYPIVREKVKFLQRDFASKNDCVMEGRDIGSQVLPEAEYKFFVTAPVEVRAKRRFDQERLNQPNLTFEEVLEDLKKRDYLDETRKIAPLTAVKDSIIINTAGKSIEESLNECLSWIK